jgi:hypothetical protein
LEGKGSDKIVEGETITEHHGGIDLPEGTEESKECLVCLSEQRNTIIMPCGHMCVCLDCGEALRSRKHNCPICRGLIGSLVPLKVNKAK